MRLSSMTSDTDLPTAQPAPDTRRVVVGYDGSPAASAALDRGIVLARALSVPLRLVAAWQYPTSYGGYPIVGWSPQEDTQIMLEAAVRQRFGSSVPDWFTAETVEGGAARVLIRESRDAQMLVVGSRGHGGFVGLLLGSVSSACAEHAECPVLVMHAPRVDHDDPIDAGAEALGDGGPTEAELATTTAAAS